MFSLLKKRIPTTDLYFANSYLFDFSKGKNIKIEGPNSFSNDGSIIICRREEISIVRRLMKDRQKKLYYIIDDNLWCLDKNLNLPDHYRERLIKLRDGVHAEIIESASKIVVSSRNLELEYRERGYNTFSIDPYWSETINHKWNFEGQNIKSPLRIGYLGTRSHVEGRKFVSNVFEGLLNKCANVKLVVFDSYNISKKVREHADVKVLKYKSWNTYRKILRSLNLDILLYPFFSSDFDNARSLNKIFEHAVCGGLGIYSANWMHADIVKTNGIGVTLDNVCEVWVDEIFKFGRERNFEQYEGTLGRVNELNECARLKQLKFWREELC